MLTEHSAKYLIITLGYKYYKYCCFPILQMKILILRVMK